MGSVSRDDIQEYQGAMLEVYQGRYIKDSISRGGYTKDSI